MSISKFNSFGKFLDQPSLVAKFDSAVPKILVGGSAVACAYDTYKSRKEDRKNTAIKNGCVLSATVLTALAATRGLKINGKTIMKGLLDVESPKNVFKQQTELISQFINTTKDLSIKSNQILEKAKSKVLSHTDLKDLHSEIGHTKSGNGFLKNLIPDPENLSAKEIFGEIKDLSILGLIPVVGGIAGGIAGDAITEKEWKKRTPDKIKEGFYQFFANIFLCNVGAGIALFGLEKMNIKSTAARAVGMIGGVIITGVIGGSAIANFMANKLINPLFKGKEPNKASGIQSLYSERKPEAMDLALHIDDMATVGVLAGFKWIGPLLPVLYSISGYKAGIGYRNGETKN